MSSAILVTGAAGFAGGHLVELLARHGSGVTGWHRPGGDPPFDVAGVSWEAVDLLDAAAVRASIERLRPSVVYHCAGAAHVGQSWASAVPTLAVNVRGTHFLLEALRLSNVTARVLLPSSAMVYRPVNEPLTEDHPLVPASPYGVSKLAQELLAARPSERITVIIGRAFNHVGPRQDPSFAASGFARQLAEIELGRREPEVVVGNLDARREATDVRDTVRAYQIILERGQPGLPYNVSSGTAIAIGELLEMLVSRARAPVRIRVDGARFRPNDQPLLVGNPRRLREELGWTPEIPLAQTIEDLLDYWRQALREVRS
jgi:GDP-4-dehydro-6-deoxy-D-mannose reductase